MRRVFIFLSAFSFMSGSVYAADYSAETGFGPHPVLPEPEKSLLPTMKTAQAIGWQNDEGPAPAPGFKVNSFVRGLDHPRWIYVLPNNDVLVAETDAPEKPADNKGVKGWVAKKVQQYAGSGTGSANRITLLRDSDGDGFAETRTTFLENLNSPFGMALVGQDFYVANTDAIMRFSYNQGETEITTAGTKLADLPGGALNHHWTKSLISDEGGKYLYAGIGSNSNVAENGIDKEENRAAILQIERTSGKTRVFASGLRNPVGMDWEPVTSRLWTAVNERDELGNDLVPDYMTSVQDGGFYGWPYSYFGSHVDERVKPPRPDLVAKAIVPDYALGSHTASLGLTFNTEKLFPAKYKGGAFVGQHGSWNRDPRAGYKVIFVPFANGKPAGMPEDILGGFVTNDDKAMGRPVGVVFDKKGALLVADDVGDAIWRVVPE